MDFSDDWKSLWPILSVFSAPRLLSAGGGGVPSSTKSNDLGPLIFNPTPKTLTQLFTSHSLSPPFPPPFPHLSLTRFLHTSGDTTSSLLLSTSSSVARNFGPQLSDDAAAALRHNRLQLLRCGPVSSSVLIFFPTGDNSDRIGFLVLTIKDGNLNVKGDGSEIFRANHKLNHRILRLLVNPVPVFGSGNFRFTTVGHLLACTLYSVHWFRARIWGLGSDSERLVLENAGSKFFKSSSVVHACWSPHLPEESVVLLESGELFLFDLESSSRTPSSNVGLKGKKLRVLWDDSANLKKGKWLSCEFSWHLRILIVVHSNAVFLVDLRTERCIVSCLLKIETLVMDNSEQDDRFVAFSRAGSDGFYFTVASDHWLLLCDVRKPLMPLLRWSHNVANPGYINVISLADLRSHPKDEKYNWASESGYCIIMGSFWNCEFSLFCYGPATRRSVASEIARFSKSFYAWELPSDLSISGWECHCGSCVVREEFSKNSFPDWIDWRQKKEMVLGFGILNKDLSAQLCEPGGFGGFTLIRLMSSGKLESQRFSASWEFTNFSEEAHRGSSLHLEDSLLYAVDDEEYKFLKKYKYLKLDYMNGYLKGGLTKILTENLKKPKKGCLEKDSLRTDFHQHVCEKLKACGFNRSKSSSVVPYVFKDIWLPTSIHEIAFRSMWICLPVDLLRLAFSTYPEFIDVLVNKKRVFLEFLGIPSQPQLPPFFFRDPSGRSNKWSKKVQPGDDLVGPVLPLPVLPILHKLCEEEAEEDEEVDELAIQTELTLKCNEVLQVANQMAGSDVHDDHVVSLAEDREEMCYGSQRENSVSLYKPVAVFDTPSYTTPESPFSGDESFVIFVSKTPEKDRAHDDGMTIVGLEFFSSLSPLEPKFHDRALSFGPEELKAYKLLKKQYSNYLEKFN